MKEDGRTRILGAASRLFLEGGSGALSVRAISKEAGLSTIGIYSHFQGKQGILDTLYMEGFAMVDETTKITSQDESALDIVMRGASNYLNFAEHYPGHYQLIFGVKDKDYTPSEEAKQVAHQSFARLTKLAAVILPEGANGQQRREIAMQVWALLHGFVSLHLHEVSEDLDWNNWKTDALNAVKLHIQAIMARCA